MTFSSLLFISQNLSILIIFLFAFAKRSDHSLHKRLNLFAVIWDLLLIIQIEVTRTAIDTAIHPEDNSSLLNFHIAIAVIVVLLYPIAIYSGFQTKKARDLSLAYS